MSDKTVFENAIVVTMDGKRRIIEKGSVVVEADRILEVGETEDIRKRHKADHVIDSRRKALLPGLVSLHFHSTNFLRGVGDDLVLEERLNKLAYPMFANMKPEDTYRASLLAYIEAIKGGTTCVNDMQRHLSSCAKAAEETGLRVILSSSGSDLVPGQETLADNERAFRELIGLGNHRITVRFGIEWIPVCSTEFLAKARELANRYKTGLHMHLNESVKEVETSRKTHGLRPTEVAYYEGVLGTDCVAAHCVWLSNQEMKILKETGTNVAHCPVSNAKYGNGVARVSQMLQWGINVGLGPDGASCNNNVDMFETMKYASLLQKATLMDPSALPASQALEMATINGAKALDMAGEIGSIEAGKKADIILVDLNTPRFTPLYFGQHSNVVSHLVYAAHGDDVDTVMVDGRLIMKDRRVTLVDEQDAIDRATEAARRMIPER